jgi:hypothetical protein
MEVSLWKAVLSVHGGTLHTHKAQLQRLRGHLATKQAKTAWNPRRWIRSPNPLILGETPALAPVRRAG